MASSVEVRPSRPAIAAKVAINAFGDVLVVGTASAALADVAAAMPVRPDGIVALLEDPGFAAEQWVEVAEALRPYRWREVLLLRECDDVVRMQQLADRLDAEVLVPSGQLLTVPGGTLFTVKPGRAGHWQRYRSGSGTVDQTGPWFPAPAWAEDLPPTFMLADDRIVVDLIPAGLWIRRPLRQPVGVDHLIYSMPPGPDPVVLLWSPGGKRPLRTEEVSAVVQALPDRLRTAAALLPYDEESAGAPPLSRAVAQRVGRPVRQQIGFRLTDSYGRTAAMVVDPAGRPTWEPYAYDVRYPPDPSDPPELVNWRPPVAGVPAHADGVYRVSERWSVEVVAAGLWLRPDDGPSRRDRARLLAPDPGYCTLVIGDEFDDLPPTVWPALSGLVEGLPADVRRRLRLVLGDQVGRDGIRRTREFAERFTPALPVERSSVAGLTRGVSVRDRLRVLLHRTVGPAEGLAAAGPRARPLPPEGDGPRRPPPSPQFVTAGRDHLGTPGEHTILRDRLGPRYDTHSHTVERLLAAWPALGRPVSDGFVADLIGLCEFATSEHVPYQRALRTGECREIDAALVSCAVGGVRRMPTWRGPVLCGGPPITVGDYRPGDVVTERGMIGGTTDPAAALGAPVEYLIWSVTARRLRWFVPPYRSSEVVFPPGTRMRVLDVVPAGGCTRVLLVDDLVSEAADVRDRVLAVLAAFAAERDGTPPTPLCDHSRSRMTMRIGLTPAGAPQLLPRMR